MKKNDNVATRFRSVGLTRASFCDNAVEVAGRRFVPDEDVAYVKFELSHSFPVVVTDGTSIHPQVVANSFSSMEGKVFNIQHLIRNYNPDKIPRDMIIGTIMAVEFPPQPIGGWKVQSDPSAAPGIVAVAAMHKQAQGVARVLETWAEGKTPWTKEPWAVSMENIFDANTGGFLVHAANRGTELDSWLEATPEDLRTLGYVYVPVAECPDALYECLNTEEDDRKEDDESFRVVRKYGGAKPVYLVGGLDGKIRYQGVALVAKGKEKEAVVKQMLASEVRPEAMAIVEGFAALGEMAERVVNNGLTR